MGLLLSKKGRLWKVAFNEPTKTLSQGIANTLNCTLNPEIVPGAYYADCAVEKVYVNEHAGDEAMQKQLWEVTEEILNKL